MSVQKENDQVKFELAAFHKAQIRLRIQASPHIVTSNKPSILPEMTLLPQDFALYMQLHTWPQSDTNYAKNGIKQQDVTQERRASTFVITHSLDTTLPEVNLNKV
jgi:hypothetical protein